MTPSEGGADQMAPPPDSGPDSGAPGDSGPSDAPPDSPVVCDADAGQTKCGATCVVTATNGSHCGACGHDCLGGTCVNSLCQPITLATLQHDAYRLAANGSYVVFTVNDTAGNGGGAYYVSASGTNQTPTTLRSQNYATVVAMHGTAAYWVGSESGYRTIETGTAGTANSGAATSKGLGADSTWNVTGLALDSAGTTLGYVHTAIGSSSGMVGACPVSDFTSCGSASFSATSDTGGLATDDTYLYFGDVTASRIKKMPIGIGSITDFVSNGAPNPGHIVYSSSYLYWSNDGQGIVARAAVMNPSQTTVASVNSPNGMAADAKYVYMSGGANSLDYVPVAGGTPTSLAPANNITEIARDSTALYYYNHGDATLRKVALPL